MSHFFAMLVGKAKLIDSFVSKLLSPLYPTTHPNYSECSMTHNVREIRFYDVSVPASVAGHLLHDLSPYNDGDASVKKKLRFVNKLFCKVVGFEPVTSESHNNSVLEEYRHYINVLVVGKKVGVVSKDGGEVL